VLQFGLEGGEESGELPSEYPVRCVAYTGTHDNNTSRGWFEAADEATRIWVRRVLDAEDDDVPWRMTEVLWQSPAAWALTPLQDLLSLGGEARMNFPGRGTGNWTWRAEARMIQDGVADRVRALNDAHARHRST
jgi:4-alpha-glucanotransferase